MEYSSKDVEIAIKVINDLEKNKEKSEKEPVTSERIERILKAKERVSARVITDLDPKEVFVFGSNDMGMHLGRASKTAHEIFGAKMGKAEGFHESDRGRTYAIPTFKWDGDDIETMAEEERSEFGDKIIEYKKCLSVWNNFLNTAKACGYKIKDDVTWKPDLYCSSYDRSHFYRQNDNSMVAYLRSQGNYDVKDVTRRTNHARKSDQDDECMSDNNRLSKDDLKKSIDRFIDFAKKESGLNFLVTRVGCGYGEFKDEDVAKMFEPALELTNVYLPQSFLDVLFEEEVIDSPLDLIPSQSGGAKTFLHELDVKLSLYTNWIRKRNGESNEFAFRELGTDEKDACRRLYDCVESICNNITNAVTLYMKGLPAEAYHAIDEAMRFVVFGKKYTHITWNEHIEEIKDYLEEIKVDKTFYRMRHEKDNWERRNINQLGMFHIPSSLRGIVKTQRYSVAGYPCLYLSESGFGCWEELGRPSLSECLISRYKNEETFRVLDLTIPEKIMWEGNKNTKQLMHLILRFPLIIACTFRTHETKDNFKPEYIVPQLLLQWIKERAYDVNKGKDYPQKVAYGIKYTSVNYPLPLKEGNTSQTGEQIDYNTGKYRYTNYAIPVIDIKDEQCSVLRRMFCWEEPYCEEFEKMFSENNEHYTSNKQASRERNRAIIPRFQNLRNQADNYIKDHIDDLAGNDKDKEAATKFYEDQSNMCKEFFASGMSFKLKEYKLTQKEINDVITDTSGLAFKTYLENNVSDSNDKNKLLDALKQNPTKSHEIFVKGYLYENDIIKKQKQESMR